MSNPVKLDEERLAKAFTEAVLSTHSSTPSGKRALCRAAIQSYISSGPERAAGGMREALVFYRDAWNFKPNKRYGGLEWTPKDELLDDCGNRARSILEGVS